MSDQLYGFEKKTRKEDLMDLQARLSPEAAADDETFRRMIERSVLVLELYDGELADALKVSRPTVNRWRNGRNLPHPVMRNPIIRWLKQEVRAKLRRLQAIERDRRATAAPGPRVRAAAGRTALRVK